jgi:hypothetical protein
MSTNALIGTTNEDGTVDAIYLHWDGYRAHALTMLAHYASSEAAAELVSMGDCSVLRETLAFSTFYARDCDERMADVKAQHLEDRDAFALVARDFLYAYLWTGTEWNCTAK